MAVVVAEVVVEETKVAKVVIIPVTIAPSPLKTLMLSIAIALLRRRRKVSGSNLLTIKIFITTHARYVIALPRRTIVIYTLSTDLDRTL